MTCFGLKGVVTSFLVATWHVGGGVATSFFVATWSGEIGVATPF